ncbi:MAG: AMP-binding protein [Clostridia bacterium]|nr:AMP-binding protein [Clostridia bacterium]
MKKVKDYPVREIQSVKEMLETSCKEYKDRIAYYTKEFGDKSFKEIKYEQLLEDVNALGTALLDLGLKDKNIAVIGENRYYWACSYLATVCGVGIVVPLDRMLPKQEIESCLERAKVSVLIYSDKTKETIEEISQNDYNKIEYYIGMDKKEDDGNNISFNKLLEKGRELIEKGDRRFIDAPMDIEKVAEILFTSGTTSKSKAVMLSQKNIIFNIYQHNKMIGIRKEDIFLSFLPIHHVYECVCGFLTPIYRGSAVAYCQGLRYIQEDMKEAHISVFLCVPLVFESMYKKIWNGIDKQEKTKLVKTMIKITNVLQKVGIDIKRKIFKDIHNQFGGNVRLFIAGAASVNPETCAGFRNFGISTVQGYGLSECAPIVALNRDTYYKDDAIGLPLEGTELKIEDVNEDGIGEICTKGDHVMLGYYENEEATKEAIKEGWFYTGDLGYIDKDGFVHMTGRKKNVLITKNGKNVYPEEIEEVLNNSEYISESMVYLKGEEDNKKIVADLILNKEYIEHKLPGKTPEEIKQIIWEEVKKINQSLVVYKHVTEINIRENEFEKTTTLKIKRYIELKK